MAGKKMRKYEIKVYDAKDRLIHKQPLHETQDIQITQGSLNKNFPDWDHYTITKDGFVNEYGN